MFPVWGPSCATAIVAVIVLNQIAGPILCKISIKKVGEVRFPSSPLPPLFISLSCLFPTRLMGPHLCFRRCSCDQLAGLVLLLCRQLPPPIPYPLPSAPLFLFSYPYVDPCGLYAVVALNQILVLCCTRSLARKLARPTLPLTLHPYLPLCPTLPLFLLLPFLRVRRPLVLFSVSKSIIFRKGKLKVATTRRVRVYSFSESMVTRWLSLIDSDNPIGRSLWPSIFCTILPSLTILPLPPPLFAYDLTRVQYQSKPAFTCSQVEWQAWY